MQNETKRKIVSKARLICGLVDLLKDDLALVKEFAITHNYKALFDSLKETKATVESLRDNLKELEYELYLLEKGER